MSTEVVNIAATPPNTAEQKPGSVEQKPNTPEVPSQKVDDMSAKFAALAKKEKIARMAHAQAKQKEQTLAERERAIAERERLWDEEFKQSPLEAIKKRGYSYEDLTKAALNDGKFDPEVEVRGVKSELQKFKEEQVEKEKRAKEEALEAQKRQEEQTVNTFKSNIKATIEKNKEKYELTSLYEADGMVFETIEEHFRQTTAEGSPKVLSIDEACELVEKYLESELDRAASTSKKFQSKYQAIKAKEDAAAQKQSSGKTTTTLTNESSLSAAPSLLSTATENDRIKRALAALG